MKEEVRNLEEINNFLSGKMSAEQVLNFTGRMKQDEDLRKAVFMQKLIVEKIRQHSEDELTKEFQRIHTKYFGKNRRRRILWIFLAGITVLIGSYEAIDYLSETHTQVSSKDRPAVIEHVAAVTEKKDSVLIIIEKKPQIKTKDIVITKPTKPMVTVPPPPFYIETKFERKAVDDMNKISYLTDGQLYFSNASSLSDAIRKIVSEELVDGTEVAIMVDKTQSMGDDIENVKMNVDRILKDLEKKKDVKVCISSFADANFTGNDWFTTSGFTTEHTKIKNFLNSIKLINGGDVPESTYDAVCYQIDEVPFTSDTKRMIVIISDASAQKGEFTVNDMDSMVKKCKENKVSIYSIAIELDKK